MEGNVSMHHAKILSVSLRQGGKSFQLVSALDRNLVFLSFFYFDLLRSIPILPSV